MEIVIKLIKGMINFSYTIPYMVEERSRSSIFRIILDLADSPLFSNI